MAIKPAEVGFHEDLAREWSQKYEKLSFRKRLAAFDALLPSKSLSNEKWLDVGCGAGNIASLLVDRGANVYGLDGSPAMISEAQKRFHGVPNVLFETIDDLDTWDGTHSEVDGIVCSSVIEYLKNPERLLQQFGRMLRGQGTLLISFPNRGSLLRMAQKAMYHSSKYVLKEPLSSYLEHSKNDAFLGSMRSLLSKHDLSVVASTYFGCPRKLTFFEGALVSPLILIQATKR